MFPRKAFGYLLRSGAGVTTLGAAGIVSVGGHNNVLADVGAGEVSVSCCSVAPRDLIL